MPWNDNLNGRPLEIAGSTAARLRVMAGPGTGKSYAMKRRVARLLEEGAEPEQILAVTFTRTAAADLLKELTRNLGVQGCERINASTLHGYCFGVLSKAGVLEHLGRVPRPITSFSKVGSLQFEASPMLEDLALLGAFGDKRARTKKVFAFEAAWARLQDQEPGWPQDRSDRAFHAALLNWMRFHECMLVGEVVPLALKYLRDNPAAEELTAYAHVIVDEYQDLNKAEQVLLNLLSETGALAVVGDEDQSIYRFRHAHPDGIREFSVTHPTTVDQTLDECRRCPRAVVEMANSLILNNHDGDAQARLRPHAPNPNGDVVMIQWPSPLEEAEGLARYVHDLVTRQQVAARDILILSPRRQLGYAVRDALTAFGVSVHSFYHEEALEAEEAQDAFSYLKLLAAPEDRVTLRFLLGQGHARWRATEYALIRAEAEARGVSPRAVLNRIVSGEATLAGTNRIVARYRDVNDRITGCQGLNTRQVTDILFPDGAEWAKGLREALLLEIEENPEASLQNLVDHLTSVVTHPEVPEDGDFVRVMSLHKSKGLTSKIVIIGGCVQGLIPALPKQTVPQAERDMIMQEQRRLFYVALTRATERLIVSSFTRLTAADAHRMNGIKVTGRGRNVSTIASEFINEMGQAVPRPVTGSTWLLSIGLAEA